MLQSLFEFHHLFEKTLKKTRTLKFENQRHFENKSEMFK